MGDRTRIFCVGMAKSGTHSIAQVFSDAVRSRHEASAAELLPRILQFVEGRLADQELTSYIRQRDEQLRLDIDSSQLNFFILNILLREFPAARFVLTIRDPYSWVDSFIDDSLRRTTSEDWIRLRDIRFRRSTFDHPDEERVLKEYGLYTLDGYFSYWRMHNDKVLSSIPPNQLLVLRTDQITQRISELADFASLPRSVVRAERSHAFRNPQRFGIFRKLDKDYVKSKIALYCRGLTDKFFPETMGWHS
jgi:hypothetical protein